MAFVGSPARGLIQGGCVEGAVRLVAIIEPWHGSFRGSFRCPGGALSLNNSFQDAEARSDRLIGPGQSAIEDRCE